MIPALEIHIPISPTKKFFLQVQFLVHSLRRNGGAHAESKVVVTVGDDRFIPDLYSQLPWMREHGVEMRWVPQQLYDAWSYYSTAVERFRYDFHSDVVMMLDADTVFYRPIDGLVEKCAREPALYGAIAHISPLTEGSSWADIWAQAGLPEPETPHEHTGWGYMFNAEARRHTPAYFNLGVLLTTPALMSPLGDVIYDMMDASDRVAETNYRCQIGVALAIAKLDLPHVVMPLRYNYPNDFHIEALHPEDAADVRIIHYLRENQDIGRNKIFTDRTEMLKFIGRKDLRVTNLKLQSTIADLFEEVDREQRQVSSEWRW